MDETARTQLKRFLIWKNNRSEGWSLEAQANTWAETSEAYLEALQNAYGSEVIITEYCPVRFEDARKTIPTLGPHPLAPIRAAFKEMEQEKKSIEPPAPWQPYQKPDPSPWWRYACGVVILPGKVHQCTTLDPSTGPPAPGLGV